MTKNEKIAALEQQIAELEQQLATLREQLAELRRNPNPTPAPAPTPAPVYQEPIGQTWADLTMGVGSRDDSGIDRW